MEEGKDLIRYFSVPCKPTKTNGGRTRNLPQHAPEKWATYKATTRRTWRPSAPCTRRCWVIRSPNTSGRCMPSTSGSTTEVCE